MVQDFVGIDFGTSNCVVAAWVDDQLELIRLDDQAKDPFKIRSTIFITNEDAPLPKADPARVQSLLAGFQAELKKEQKARSQALGQMSPDSDGYAQLQRQLSQIDKMLVNERPLRARAERQALSEHSPEEDTLDKLLSSGTIYFGEEGFQEFLHQPKSGRFITSPKNFLGSRLGVEHLHRFESIVARFLTFLRKRAEQQLGRPITRAVIGRPVHYHSTMGEAGNKQALEIMQSAAAMAGFTEVEFLYEPLGAAFHFEKGLKQPTKAMIVDLGGGTSDVTLFELSAERSEELDRDQDLLSVDGIRQGGIACDKLLAKRCIAPTFGRGGERSNGLPISHGIYEGMVEIDDLPKLNDFYSEQRQDEIEQLLRSAVEPDKIELLQQLQERRLVHRLMHATERAKIELSDNEQMVLPLEFVQPELGVGLSRDSLTESMRLWLSKLQQLMNRARQQAGCEPEFIYLTGGMGLSPIVQAAITQWYPDVPIKTADAFSSVASGAAIHAKRLFG